MARHRVWIGLGIVLLVSHAASLAVASPIGQGEAALLAQLSRAHGSIDFSIATGRSVLAVPLASRAAPTLPERRALEPLAEAAAQQHGVSVDFFKRLIRQESGYNPNAVSIAGAQGIAQFMPATAAQVGLDDPFNPQKALPKSAEHLADLQRRLGNEGLAAAAYNAGEGRVRAWLAGRSGLPLETQNYVRSITGRFAYEWAPAGTMALPAVDYASLPGPRAPRTPTFARLQSAEWQIGMKLMASQSRLTALLDHAGEARRRPPAYPLGRKIGATAPVTGEKALCASMGRGCIVANVY
ncbi:lytic transglycosylase domain-containing protein [Methylobacterium sp. NFXW15]|uniref:lytic transglycosylase domain-containing protein n=1 Tax=Methylobacterium sp. NFXW15 TaxID=2819512 RepID=UPI003CEEDF1F